MRLRLNKRILLALLLIPALRAEDLDPALAKLSENLAAGISKAGSKKISVIDFTDLQGHPSELGRFIAEEISVALVNSAKEFSVMDRANMKVLLDEHKLTASGLVDPQMARELGRFSGVDAIVLGSITPLGDSLSITAKAILTETTQVIAAAKITVPKTKELDTLLKPAPTTQQKEKSGASQAPQADKNEKDFSATNGTSNFDSIAVELVSFRVSTTRSVVALIKVTNRNKKYPLRIGLNALRGNQVGAFLLDEETGNTLPVSDVRGLSYATGVYGNESSNFQGLKRMAAEADRRGDQYGAVRQLFEELDRNTEVGVSQSIIFTIQFVNQSRTLGSVFRLNLEIVVAEVIGNERARVSLNNIVISGIRPK